MINDSAKERQRQSKEAGRLAKKQARDDIREARKVDIEKRRLANAEKRRRQEIANDAIMVTRIAGSIIAADGEEARKAAISNALDIATVKISARAAEGAAGAFTSAVEELGWFFGPIVGAAAGTAVFASIMALRTQVIGMATGGAVQGKDSINAKLMPGEVGHMGGPEQWHWMKGGDEGGIVTEYATYHDGEGLRFTLTDIKF